MNATTPITPPGWYDDGHGRLRWWDGSQWTEHTAPLAQAAAQVRPAQQVAPARPPVRREDLVEVKGSKLVWILPLVFLVAAGAGALSAAALWSSGGLTPAPLERAYADFVAAESASDCAALEKVTTRTFRNQIYDQPFTCELFTTRPTGERVGTPQWGMRMGPVGILVVKEEFPRDQVHDRGADATVTAYTLIREDGRWKLDSDDA